MYGSNAESPVPQRRFVDRTDAPCIGADKSDAKSCESDYLTLPATGSAESREKPICS